MMNRVQARRLFDAERPVYAQRQMLFGETVLELGEELKWRELGLDQSEAERLFRLRMISHFPGGDQSRTARAEYKPDQQVEDEPVVEETSEAAGETETVTEVAPAPEPEVTKKKRK